MAEETNKPGPPLPAAPGGLLNAGTPAVVVDGFAVLSGGGGLVISMYGVAAAGPGLDVFAPPVPVFTAFLPAVRALNLAALIKTTIEQQAALKADETKPQ